MEWPTPSSSRQVRAFLGLTGYYRKFVATYSQIAIPLTDLLKKGNFHWNEEAEKVFNELKIKMTTTPVLRYPNFNRPFIVETDTCDYGIGAVLTQDERPLAYFSKKISDRRQHTSTYAKELLAVVEAVSKWLHYLLGSKFIVRTDHHSLKNLLKQTVQTPDQHFFLSKLLGYDFTIEYKRGRDNIVADALSRQMEEENLQLDAEIKILCSSVYPEWMNQLLNENKTDPWLLSSKAKADRGE